MGRGPVYIVKQVQHSLPQLGEVLEHTAGAGIFHFHNFTFSGIRGNLPSTLTHSTLIRIALLWLLAFVAHALVEIPPLAKLQTIFHVLLLTKAFLCRERHKGSHCFNWCDRLWSCEHVQIPPAPEFPRQDLYHMATAVSAGEVNSSLLIDSVCAGS